jgi:hypothetical protein
MSATLPLAYETAVASVGGGRRIRVVAFLRTRLALDAKVPQALNAGQPLASGPEN